MTPAVGETTETATAFVLGFMFGAILLGLVLYGIAKVVAAMYVKHRSKDET